MAVSWLRSSSTDWTAPFLFWNQGDVRDTLLLTTNLYTYMGSGPTWSPAADPTSIATLKIPAIDVEQTDVLMQ